MSIFSNPKLAKTCAEFYCKNCDYTTKRKSSFDMHIMTAKHKKSMVSNPKLANSAKTCNEYICQICQKSYKDNSGLWRHKQKCSQKNFCLINEEKEDNQTFDKDLILSILQQNKEFKDVIIEQSKQIVELAKNGNCVINNTTNNQQFNMNFFLNEQCKGALDIMDFIGSLKVQLSDLENTGKDGYVKGISDIFLRNLKELDLYKRPIHCSDLKREVMYVKDKDVWEKDEEKKKMKLVIKHIADKNLKQIQEWVRENPDAKDIETRKHEQYMKILSKCTGGVDYAEDDVFYKKIITNIAKEVQIDKTQSINDIS
jgi:hypothetical protein